MDAVTAKRKVAGVFERAAPAYGTTLPFFDEVARDLVAYTGIAPGDRVLDVGCGRGAALFAAAEAAGPAGRLVGIDLAPGMVRLASQTAERRGLRNVRLLVGDAEAPDVGQAEFDAVLASIVLFFLPDAPAALRRYRGVLAPGGRLGFSTIVDRDWERWHPVELALRGSVHEADPRGRSDRLLNCLPACGFARPETCERRYDNVFADPEHWWAWAKSSGQRSAIEAIPVSRLDEARRAALNAVESLREADGRIVWRPVVRFTRAEALRPLGAGGVAQPARGPRIPRSAAGGQHPGSQRA
jgi:SAM-dependent methyltransferase